MAVRRRRRAVVPLLLLLGVACGGSEAVAGQEFQPSAAGRLTVATSLPAPGFWTGDGVGRLTGGFEYGIAEALAERFDLDMAVIDVPFDRLVAGDLGGADLALAQITVTDERAGVLDFSIAYYRDDAGVVMGKGRELADLETAREQGWAVERATTEADLLDDEVRPDPPSLLVDDAVAAVAAVAEGRVDAALVDLSTALILARDRADVGVGGRFVVGQGMAVALPEGSGNVEVVDAAIRALENDGTLDDLTRGQLEPLFATDPDRVPVVRTAS